MTDVQTVDPVAPAPGASWAPPEVLARLTKLRAHLEAIPNKHFDMDDWTCGSAACIGGWAERLFFRGENFPGSRKVGAALGLTTDQSETLFFMKGAPDGIGFKNVNRKVAVAVLDVLIDTGAVDWSAAIAKATGQ